MNPFKDWRPQMVDDYNKRQEHLIDAALDDDGQAPDNHPTNNSPLARALAGTHQQKPRKPLMNKTEARYMDILKHEYPGRFIGAQNITLRLGFDLRYTPDLWHVGDNGLVFYEVKGPFIWSRALVKPKTAAQMFPMFQFFLAQYKDGVWTITPIRTL